MSNLELVIQYFWILKALSILVLAFTVGKAVVIHKLKSKLWNIIAVIMLVVAIVSPVKLSLSTNVMHYQQDIAISATKVLNEKLEDKSFSETIKSLKGIQKTDIEEKQ